MLHYPSFAKESSYAPCCVLILSQTSLTTHSPLLFALKMVEMHEFPERLFSDFPVSPLQAVASFDGTEICESLEAVS